MSQSVYVLSNGLKPQEDLSISALRTVEDPDRISSTPNYTYAWERSAERSDNPAAWQRITGATALTYSPGDADVGFFLRAVLGYVDGANNVETVIVATEETVANVNDRPTHNLRLIGNFTENGAVSVGVQAGVTDPPRILDADNVSAVPIGLVPFDTVRYAWFADNALLAAEGSSLQLTQDEVGKRIEVRIAYTDARGTEESISLAATSLITNINDAPTGAVLIDGTPAQGSVLQASNTLDDADGMPVGANAFSYAWFANGAAISGANQASLLLTQTQVGKTVTVRATYTDRFGAVETRESAATVAIENVNDLPVGVVRLEAASTPGSATTIAREDFALRAVNAFTDADGLPATVSVRWQVAGSANNASDWVDIEGDRGASAQFAPGDAEVGQFVRALVRYTDALQTDEEIASAAIGPIQNVNDPAVGIVKVVGTPRQGETLSVSAEIRDNDGPLLVESGLSYQWFAGNTAIAGATVDAITLEQAQVGSTIRVRVSFQDDRGGAESLFSGFTAAVADIDDEPMGSVRVQGEASQGQTLTVDHSLLVDVDGPKKVLSTQWLADGQPINGAVGSQLALTQQLVDKTISVKLRYSDGTNERDVLSDETGPVQDVQDAPSGAVTLTGASVPVEKATLTASAQQIADLDGVGDIGWEWLANGQIIPSDGSNVLELTQALVGARIAARASYRDGLGKVEQVTSAQSAAVANVNDPLEGDLSVEGALEQGRTLTVRHTISDLDGIPASGAGALSFQWLSGGVPIPGATGLSFVATQAQVGKTLGVRASYVDLFGKAHERLEVLSEVGNVNDAPVSTLRLEGPLFVGATLRRAGQFVDADGISPEALAAAKTQWLVGGAPLDGADGSTLKIDRSMAGKSIALQVSYTDAMGADELVSASVSGVSFARVAGQVYHWRSHALMPGAEVVIEGKGLPADGVSGQGGSAVTGVSNPGTGAYVPPAVGLEAAAASGLALRAVGFDSQGDLHAEVWLDPGVFVNQLSAKLSVSGPGAVQFTPAAGALPESWSALSSVVHSPGGGDIVLESGTTELADSVMDARLLGTLRLDLPAAAGRARIALEQADFGGSVVAPYELTLARGLSNAQGGYGIEDLDFEAFAVQAQAPLATANAASLRAAITSADALAALKLVTGRNPNADADGMASGTSLPPGVSPYQIIAADVNRDGIVTADDARLILAMASGRPGAPAPEWVLVREDQGYGAEAGAAKGFALTRTAASFQPDETIVPGSGERGGWVAVLLGDVDGSWRPADPSAAVLAPSYFEQLNVDLGVPLGQFGVG